jgi:hypothetical protein
MGIIVPSYRGHWDGAIGSSNVDSTPISINAGEILVVGVGALSHWDDTTATVWTTSPDWGFTDQVHAGFWGNSDDGAYSGVFALVAAASLSPTVHVQTGGSPSNDRRPCMDIFVLSGVDPSNPVIQIAERETYGNPITASFRSASGTGGGTLAIIRASDAFKVGAPYVTWPSGAGTGQDQSGGFRQGISGFTIASDYVYANTDQNIYIDPPGSDGAVYVLVSMEFRPLPLPPTVGAGADASWTYGTSAFNRTASESGGGGVTAREWKIVSGPAGAGTVLSTSQTVIWSPTVGGAYVLRYTATNPVGSNSDDVTITVVGLVATISAGPDRATDRTVTLPSFSATETATGGSAITAREWKVVATAQVLSTTIVCPPLIFDTAGSYTLRYSATNATGTATDDMVVTVRALRPVVDAGPDEARGMGLITRTAQEQAGDNAITSRQWKIQDGPLGVGTVIGTAADLSWTPPSLGRWVLRYTATSAAGASDPDDCVISVGVSGVPLNLDWTPKPKLGVSIAFAGDLTDPDGSSWAFTEVTEDVRIKNGVHLKHGRADEASISQPATCGFTLNNRHGKYSLGGGSPYWPNVRQGTPIKIEVDLGDGFITLFVGYADGFTPEYSINPLNTATSRGDATVSVSASGVLRRLAQGKPPAVSPIRRGLTNSSAVRGYWPCEDEKNSQFIASAFAGHDPMTYYGRLHGGSNPDMPAALPNLASNTDFDCSAPLPQIADSEWYGNVTKYTSSGTIQLRCLISVPDSGSNDQSVILGMITDGDPGFWELRYMVDGCINVRAWRNFQSLVVESPSILLVPGPYGVAGGFVGINGKPGQLGLTLTKVGGNIHWVTDYIVQGATTGYVYSGDVAGASVGKPQRIQTATDGGHVNVALGHIVVRSDARDTAEHIRHLNAWSGEIVGERLLRLATENLLSYTQPDGDVHVVTVTDRMGPQQRATVLELFRDCETCDQGILWDGLSPGLTYTTKRYRESRSAAMVLEATAGEVGFPFAPVHDDANRRNRVTATRTGGSTAVQEDVTGNLGSNIIGRYDDTIEVNVDKDTSAQYYAGWRVHTGTVEGYRWPRLALNLAAIPHLIADWLTIKLGDRVDVINLHDVNAAAPREPISLAVEGYEQTITDSGWDVTINTSPFQAWAVAIACGTTGDNREFGGRADTDGSTVNTLIAEGQVTLSVATPAGSPLWTVDTDDYPLYLDVGDERVRALSCTGSASPQVFAVDPMPANRPVGTPVKLWHPPVLGL